MFFVLYNLYNLNMKYIRQHVYWSLELGKEPRVKVSDLEVVDNAILYYGYELLGKAVM